LDLFVVAQEKSGNLTFILPGQPLAPVKQKLASIISI
jgi:hypothetical protein